MVFIPLPSFPMWPYRAAAPPTPASDTVMIANVYCAFTTHQAPSKHARRPHSQSSPLQPAPACLFFTTALHTAIAPLLPHFSDAKAKAQRGQVARMASHSNPESDLKMGGLNPPGPNASVFRTHPTPGAPPKGGAPSTAFFCDATHGVMPAAGRLAGRASA